MSCASLSTLARRGHAPSLEERGRPKLVTVLFYLLLTVGALTMIVPFLWMLSTGLKAPGSVLTIPPELYPKHPTLASFHRVLEVVPLGRMLLNSVIVTTVTVAAQ